MALSAFIFTDRIATLIQLVEDTNFVKSHNLETMTPDELAYRC